MYFRVENLESLLKFLDTPCMKEFFTLYLIFEDKKLFKLFQVKAVLWFLQK